MAQDVAEKIRAAAIAKGIDPDTALRIAGVESSYDPNAKNPLSSAKGLFQVTDDTWKRYGGKPGKQRDTDENIRVGMDILADNTNKLSKILGRAPRPSELYTAHFFGSGTGAEVLRADPDTPINRIASKKVMAANPHLKGLTVGQLMSKHEAKFARAPVATPAYSNKKGGERQDDVEKMMTDALSSGQTAQAQPTVLDDPRIKALGTNYQMALAATALADKDEPDANGETEAERFQQYAEERQIAEAQAQEPDPARKALASFDLNYKSPFVDDVPTQQEPVRMAVGGTVLGFNAAVRPSDKKKVQSANDELKSYQTAYEQYKSRFGDYKTQFDAYQTAGKKYNDDVANFNTSLAAAQKAEQDWVNTYNSNLEGAAEFEKNTPRPTFTMTAPTFTLTAPVAPTAPDAPTVDPQAIAKAAQKETAQRSAAISVFADPDRYNLSLPKMFAGGGMASSAPPPPTGIRQSDKEAINSANAQWEQYKAGIEKYNADADAYNERVKKAKADADAWMAGYEKAGEPPKNPKTGKPMTLSTFGDLGKNVRQNKYATDNPYTAPDLTAPVRPTAPTVQPQDLLDRAQNAARNRNLAVDAFFNPDKYNLSFSHGGAVHRANGSPETGERLTPQQIEQLAADQVALNTYQPPRARPSTGMNRQRGPISDALDSGAAYVNMAKGVTELPYDLIGAPMDISNFFMTPFGKNVEKPVMGSEFLKEQATKAGIRPLPPTDPTLKGFFNVGELGANLTNPAGVVRKGVQATEAVAKGAKKAKDMLGELKKPKAVPQTARVEPAVEPAVQTELAQLNQDRQYPRARNQEPNPWMGVAPTVDEARANVAARQAEPLPAPPAEVTLPPEMVPPPPAMTQLPVSAPVAAPMQAAVSADRPFVGRLDSFIDTLNGPVQLGQLKGQLKGKFRDYDLERVERAFPGMDAKTKLTPDQIKQALAGTHSPQKWISETVAPKAGAHHQGQDNVWGAPLGTTNLYLEQTPEKLASSKLFESAAQALGPFSTGTAKYPSVEALTDARNFLKEESVVQNMGPEAVSAISAKLDKVENSVRDIDRHEKALVQINNGLLWPILYKTPDGAQPYFAVQKEVEAAIQQRFIAQKMGEGMSRHDAFMLFHKSDGVYTQMREESQLAATQRVHQMAVEDMRRLGLPEPDLGLLNWDSPTARASASDYPRLNPEFKESVLNALEPVNQQLNEASKRIKRFMDDDIKNAAKNLDSQMVYRGKHTSVASGPAPIGFTRFSEHEATIPGMGEVQGRHFHELQSDMSKDMRKSGTTSGNAAKDQAEYDKLQGELKQAQQKAMDKLQELQSQKKTLLQDGGFEMSDLKKIEGEEAAAREALDKGTRAMEKRISILGARIRDKAPYSLEEPFAGFETNQMVRQQLLMKNAIQSAMRDGKGFATFPGAEAAKPQLYVGKVAPNLKQVVKDLGGEKSGLEIRQIQLPPDKDGNPITALGVTWSPETAARIVEKGVPFAKGGMVERQSADTRRYL